MDRRSFVLSIFGGVAAAGLGGTAIAQAASTQLDIAPAIPPAGEIDAVTKSAIDQTNADFSQVVVRERIVRRPRRRRPVIVRRTIVRRPRRTIVRRRVIVR